MANPTSNFNWQMPTNTDLVKDLPADFEVFGQAVDTSLADLKGGTSGQILAKNSNTDMDFVWIANDQGDITAVNVTSPITGGGSAGAVTVGIQDGTTAQKGAVQLENSTSSTSTTTAAVPASVKSAYDLANAAIPKSLVDAAGDLIYATANDTVTRLPLGTAGQVLRVNSGATAPEWATASGGGKVLQVLQQFYSTQTDSSSSTFADTGITLNITPSSTSSKILAIVSINGCLKTEGNTSNSLSLRLMRGATQLMESEDNGFTNSALYLYMGTLGMVYLDSPSTTSATTYKVQFRNPIGAALVRINASSSESTITLMEIGA